MRHLRPIIPLLCVFLFVFLMLLSPMLYAETVATFSSGRITLHGVLYQPEGKGPFPAILYNHGSAAGLLSNEAFDALGPVFANHGWVFFAPYRRGQGLSASAGPFIGDQIAAAEKNNGHTAAVETMIRLLETDHFNDQSAALSWLRQQPFVQPNHIAVGGNSFGGIEAILGAEKLPYCAAIDAAGGAESWKYAQPQLKDTMTEAVRNARAPIFFLQAENDYDLTPSRVLSATMKDANEVFELKIYPPYGKTQADGHAFAYFGSSIWAVDVFRFLKEHCSK